MSNVVTLKRANRVITVDLALASGYLNDGYDQIDESGKVVKEATGGKTITVAEYNKVLGQLKVALSKEGSDEVAELKEEIKVLETENVRLDKLVKTMKGQLDRK